jgi:hypothetical protein
MVRKSPLSTPELSTSIVTRTLPPLLVAHSAAPTVASWLSSPELELPFDALLPRSACSMLSTSLVARMLLPPSSTGAAAFLPCTGVQIDLLGNRGSNRAATSSTNYSHESGPLLSGSRWYHN